ncbi:argonaute-like protein [Phanerochaete sordida]|uniref:Argonaute-like protein n=1 Tax=Phanerochaete sordida TaxID=48140 RepID=A0A9P3LDX8_9APHY|nr:argonaute-like protein [Phanerochaete sordida]
MSDRSGVSGTSVFVFTNMFRIRDLPKKDFNHYNVIMKRVPDGPPAEVKVRDRRREIIHKLQDDNPAIFTSRASYDGMHSMYSVAEITQENFSVSMSKNPNAARGWFDIAIKRVNKISPSDLKKLMSPNGANNGQANSVAVNLLQIIVSQAPNIRHRFALHSKSFYINDDKVPTIGPGIQLWHGFFQSVRPVLNNMLINIDTSSAPMYKAGSLLDVAMEFMDQKEIRPFIRLFDGDRGPFALRTLKSFLKGVQVNVPPGEKKVKIEDIVLHAGYLEFEKGAKQIRVMDHFMEHHRYTLRNPHAFGVRANKSAVFPAEVCRIVPGQLYKKKLDGRATSEVIKHTSMRPDVRLDKIKKAVSSDILAYRNSPFMRDAGMNVDIDPLTVQGRRIEPPAVVYGDDRLANIQNGGWNVTRQKFRRPATIVAWAVVTFDPASSGAVTGFVREFRQEEPEIRAGNEARVNQSLLEAAQACVSNVPGKPKPSFVLVILPQNAGPLRKAVKQWGDMIEGIPTQCVRAGKYERPSDQYLNNVALKINTKIGGINSVIADRVPAAQFLTHCMVVGCDVAHPSPGVISRPSIASLVASLDECATRYHTEVKVQPPRQEAIDDIGGMLQRAIVQYRACRNNFPDHIIVYRDGVSEGEYVQVENNEIAAIQAKLDELEVERGHKARLVFIVVSKRHHVRFFPKDQSNTDRSGNLHAGLVVDTGIVHSTYIDFYLQSQGGLKGTSRPSHYIVLKNNAGLTTDQLQQLSYALCHVYAAATRSVSIPAPVYYADRLCARADFQFKPELDFANDGATDTSECDLQKWREGLGQAKLNQQMYFI